ncbi:MAG: MFS transporter [Pseudomonadota bacterium]|nr:MFS transporter [Pseudomonadota bacterium]
MAAELATSLTSSRRVLAALIGGQLGMHSAMAGLRMAAPLQALHEGYSAWAVGLLLSLFAAAPVLLALPAGRLADRLGYHRPVYLAAGITILGCLLALGSTFLTGTAQFALLCVAGAATGAGANTGMLTVQRTAGLTARDSVERVRIFSWLGIAPSFSNVIGPVAAGFLIDGLGYRAAYVFLLALPLVTLVMARSVPRIAPKPLAVVAGRRAWDLLLAPGLKRLLTINWLLSTCWDVHTFAVPVLGHSRGFSASTIGLILGTFTLSVTVVRLVIPALAHRLSEKVVLRTAMLGTGIVFSAYPLAPGPLWMAGCAVLLGITLGSVQPMVMSMLHQVTPDNRHGEALALRSMAINASSTLMPLVFGATGTLVGAAALFWMVGGAVAAGSGLVRRMAT